MRSKMPRRTAPARILVVALATVLSTTPTHTAGDDEGSRSPAGRGLGHHKKRAPKGTSAGVARGDFDGDANLDLAVGVPGEDLPQLGGSVVADAGAVHVIFGTPVGIPPSPSSTFLRQSSAIGESAEAHDAFGSALAAGPFNNDRFADLAVGVPNEGVGSAPRGGVVHVLYGSSDGPLPSAGPGTQMFRSGNPAEGDDFGSSLTAWNFGRNVLVPRPCFPCFTEVKTADLAIGAPGATVTAGGQSQVGAGSVLVLYGSTNGLSLEGFQLWTQESPGIPGTSEPLDHFGGALY